MERGIVLKWFSDFPLYKTWDTVTKKHFIAPSTLEGQNLEPL